MSIRVPRNAVKDVPFNTLTAPAGSLTDQYNWTDGLTHAQWPTVRFYTLPDGGGTEITSSIAYDITSVTITSATHKDPTGSTGVWRKGLGLYRIRVQPQNALALAVYYMRVVHQPTSGNSYAEDHEFEVIAAGDTVFGDGFVVYGDVIAGISTSLDEDAINLLISEASKKVAGKLKSWCGIDAYAIPLPDDNLFSAVVDWTRSLIFNRDASAGGKISSLKEGDKTVRFEGNSEMISTGYLNSALDTLKDMCGAGAVRQPKLQIARREYNAGGAGYEQSQEQYYGPEM